MDTAKKALQKANGNPVAAQLRQERLNVQMAQRKQKEELLQQLSAEADSFMQQNITGLAVKHKLFGEGTVYRQDAFTVTVQFHGERKSFVFPSAFIEGFLTAEDEGLYQRIEKYRQTKADILKCKTEIDKLTYAIEKLQK